MTDESRRPPIHTDRVLVLNAMRSGEWLREQWIARVAFGLGIGPWEPQAGQRVRRVLTGLARVGRVEQRPAVERRTGEIDGVPIGFDIPRREWRSVLAVQRHQPGESRRRYTRGTDGRG